MIEQNMSSYFNKILFIYKCKGFFREKSKPIFANMSVICNQSCDMCTY